MDSARRGGGLGPVSGWSLDLDRAMGLDLDRQCPLGICTVALRSMDDGGQSLGLGAGTCRCAAGLGAGGGRLGGRWAHQREYLGWYGAAGWLVSLGAGRGLCTALSRFSAPY